MSDCDRGGVCDHVNACAPFHESVCVLLRVNDHDGCDRDDDGGHAPVLPLYSACRKCVKTFL